MREDSAYYLTAREIDNPLEKQFYKAAARLIAYTNRLAPSGEQGIAPPFVVSTAPRAVHTYLRL